ncbi:unnamed protein product [Calypogeia fissa]
MGADKQYEKDGSGRAWCAVILIALLIVVIVIVVLALTIFRVRDPEITVQSFQLMSFSLTYLTTGPQLSFILNVVVAVKNRNHASYKYHSSIAYIYYHGATVGSANVPAGEVKAESTTTISTQVTANPVAFLGNPSLPGDVQAGSIPLVVQTVLMGEIDVATIVKHHATTVATCNLNVLVQTQTVGGVNCNYKFSL